MRSLFFPIPKQEASGALFNDGSLSVSLLADLALASQPEVGSAVSGQPPQCSLGPRTQSLAVMCVSHYRQALTCSFRDFFFFPFPFPKANIVFLVFFP